MPLYEYRCNDCESIFDELRPIRVADSPIKCPACGSSATSRKLSLFAASCGGNGPAVSSSCQNCSSGDCTHCRN
jgi:putative FmdB family regulatory protein